MKILVTYWCNKCEKKEEKVIEVNENISVSLELPCLECYKPMTALHAIGINT